MEKETKTVGTALKATATVNASSVKLKVKQSTSGLKITGFAKGDSVKSWKSSNSKIFTVRGKSNGTCKITGKKRGTAKLQITLALSLHAPNDEKRQELMPIAQRYSMDEVLDACRNYFQETGRRITFEYSLVAGVNDSDEDAR